MAVITVPNQETAVGGDEIMPIDPHAPIETEDIAPVWPEFESIDFRRSVLSYDRQSDTLFLHFNGRAQPALSYAVGPDHYLLLDPETDEVVGFQVESFLRVEVKEMPILIVALRFAELRGISREEVRHLIWEAMPYRYKAIYLARVAAKRAQQAKELIAQSFYGGDRLSSSRMIHSH